VLWIREEALASVTQSAFVDYESASVKTTKMGIPSLATRVQMQVGDMVSLVNSLPQLVESFTKKEPIATGDAEARTQDFGLDKLILLMTAPGKLFALHTSSGRVVWSRLFKGCDKMVVTRTKPTQSNKFPEVLLPASELSADGTRKMLWVNGASGAEIEAGSFPAGVVKYMSLEADRNFNKPAEDSVGAHGMSFALVDGANQVRLFPDTEASHTSFRARATDYYYNHLMEEGGSQVLRGYTVANPKGGQGTSAAGSAYDTIPQWTVVFPKTERVIETAGHDKTEIIDSPVHIAGDDSLLLKYLNPHVIAVATVKRDAADNAVAVHGQVKKHPLRTPTYSSPPLAYSSPICFFDAPSSHRASFFPRLFPHSSSPFPPYPALPAHLCRSRVSTTLSCSSTSSTPSLGASSTASPTSTALPP
jgi:hypothetical protein